MGVGEQVEVAPQKPFTASGKQLRAHLPIMGLENFHKSKIKIVAYALLSVH